MKDKRNSTIIIDVNDVKIGEDVVVNASVTSGATGNFTFTVGNKTQTVAISDGKASAIFKGLASGNYTVKVEYSGMIIIMLIKAQRTLWCPKYLITIWIFLFLKLKKE